MLFMFPVFHTHKMFRMRKKDERNAIQIAMCVFIT